MSLDIATLGVNVDARQIQQGDRALDGFERTARRTDQTTNQLNATQARLAAGIAAVAAAIKAVDLAKQVIEQQRAFDKLNVALEVSTKSAAGAKQAFGALRAFAAQTPYDLQQTTKAFIQLVNFGLTPSERALRSYGNTAGAMGKSLSQMVEAVADATTGEFERLKEFGIKSKTEGDKIAFTFQGTTTRVGNSAKEIEKFLISLGETQFAGGMEKQAKTLDGTLSNLADTWDALLLTISQGGFGAEVQQQVLGLITLLEDLDAIIRSLTGDVSDQNKELEKTTVLGKALRTVFETVAVIGSEVAFAFKAVGKDMGALAAFAATLATDGLDAALRLAGQRKQDAAEEAAEQEKRVKGILTAADTARAAREKEAAAKAASGRDDLAQFQIQEKQAKQLSATQQKAFDDAKKKAEEYLQTLRLETQQLGATEQQQFMLAAARRAQDAPTRELKERILEAALAYTVEKEKVEALQAAQQHEEETRKARADAMLQEAKAAADSVAALQREVDTYGMGAAAIERYNLAKLNERKRNLETGEGTDGEIAQVNALIAAQEKLLALTSQREDLDSLFDTTKIESFGDALRNAFGEAGNSLAQLTNALQDYVEKQEAADKERMKVRVKYAGDEAKIAKEVAKIDDKLEKSRVDSYATMASAAKGFFKEGTKGYKLLETAERAFRAFELAEAAGALAKKLLFTQTETSAKLGAITTQTAANVASVGPNVAADGAKATASGVAAFAKTLASLPFPANIAAGAAVIALLAGVGVRLGGGGGSGKSITQQRQEQQGAGSVLGDATAKSESLSKALEALKENSDIALDFNSESLSVLKSINANIASFAARAAGMSGLTGKTGDLGGEGAAFRIGSVIDKVGGDFLGKVTSKVLGSIFGGKKSVEDTGFMLGGGSLGQLLAGGVDARQYQDILKKGGWFSSDKRSTQSTSLGADVNAEFTRILGGITKAVRLSAEQLGMSGPEFEQRLNSFAVSIGKVSLKDLKGDEIEKAIASVFSKLGDDIARYAAGGLEGFQQAGEGYLETLVRVAAGTERAQFELDRFGITAIKLADVQEKQGDVAAEIVRQSILAQESLAGVADIMRTLDGSASELADTYEQLKQVQQQLVNVGIDPATLGRQLIGGARDLSGLSDALETYFEEFFTDAEKAAAKTAELTAKFKALGFELPKSNEEFRKLIESIPKTTEEGQTLVGKLLLLSGALAELNENAGKATNSLDLANQRRELELQIMDATGRSAEATAIRRQQELAAMDASLRGLQSWLYALEDTKQAAQDAFSVLQRSVAAEKKARQAIHNAQMASYDSGIKAAQEGVSKLQQLAQTLRSSLNGMRVAGGAAGDRRDAQATIRRAISGGVDSADLQNALSVAGQDASAQFTNRTDYLRDFYRTKISVSELAQQTDVQLTAAEKQVAILQEWKAQAQAQYEASLARLDAELEQAQAQLDALNNINNSVLTIPAALSQFSAAITSAMAVKAAASGAVGAGVSGPNVPIFGAGMTTTGNPMTSWWEGTDQDYYRNIRMANKTGEFAPGFASGGAHSGGWRWVGEEGPELEYTGPSHIVSNSDSKDLMNSEPVVAAINQLRQENREWLYAIAKNTQGTDKTLKRWDYNGQPETRTE